VYHINHSFKNLEAWIESINSKFRPLSIYDKPIFEYTYRHADSSYLFALIEFFCDFFVFIVPGTTTNLPPQNMGLKSL